MILSTANQRVISRLNWVVGFCFLVFTSCGQSSSGTGAPQPAFVPGGSAGPAYGTNSGQQGAPLVGTEVSLILTQNAWCRQSPGHFEQTQFYNNGAFVVSLRNCFGPGQEQFGNLGPNQHQDHSPSSLNESGCDQQVQAGYQNGTWTITREGELEFNSNLAGERPTQYHVFQFSDSTCQKGLRLVAEHDNGGQFQNGRPGDFDDNIEYRSCDILSH